MMNFKPPTVLRALSSRISRLTGRLSCTSNTKMALIKLFLLLVVTLCKTPEISQHDSSDVITRYYFVEPHNMGGKSVSVTPFPKGFRMITGAAPKRKFYGPIPDPDTSFWQDSDRTQQSLMEKSIGFLCLHYNGLPAEQALNRHYMPNRTVIDTCDGGIRMELQFPSCWNGKDNDSQNHSSHVAYPYLKRDGDCPPGYPTLLPTLLYEIIYNTFLFNGVPGQFVFAHGDDTGFGFHGDFMNGWDDGVLQQVIDQCQGGLGMQEQCTPLTIKPDSEITGCKMETPEVIQNEAVDFLEELPGGCKVVPNVDWSYNCGNDNAVASSPVSTSAQTATSVPPSPGSEPPTVATSAALPSSTSSLSLPANTTSAAAPPATTPAPSPTSDASVDLTSYTTITTVNGTVYNLVVVEEVVTTTIVSVVGGAEPTPGAIPAGGVKRHLHRHTSETKTDGHSHGSHKRGKRWNFL